MGATVNLIAKPPDWPWKSLRQQTFLPSCLPQPGACPGQVPWNSVLTWGQGNGHYCRLVFSILERGTQMYPHFIWVDTFRKKVKVKLTQPCLTLCHSMDCSPWNSLGFVLQGTFPTQGSNPGLLDWRRILYQLSHKGSPTFLKILSLNLHGILRIRDM